MKRGRAANAATDDNVEMEGLDTEDQGFSSVVSMFNTYK